MRKTTGVCRTHAVANCVGVFLRRLVSHPRQMRPNNRGNGRRGDVSGHAVRGLHPCHEFPRPLAGVAPHAAAGDVFSGHDLGVVDDVFPTRTQASRPIDGERYATVDARPVAIADFPLQIGGDVPAVHSSDFGNGKGGCTHQSDARSRPHVSVAATIPSLGFLLGPHVAGCTARSSSVTLCGVFFSPVAAVTPAPA